LTKDELYIQRCIDLAWLGGNNVKSNPLVGAVIVYEDQIIGEGYHQKYGNHHAEINALLSVKESDKKHLQNATIYISLEPCNHHGKTPPCVTALINSGIQKVVIGSTDPNPDMMGKSVNILRSKGIQVEVGICQKKTDFLIRKFVANMNGIPFVTIKFAQSKDFFIGQIGERIQISGEGCSIFTHKLRADNDGILIGTKTAIIDNPSLTTRDYPGKSPLRIVFDRNESIPKKSKIICDDEDALILTTKSNYQIGRPNKKIIVFENWELTHILKIIYENGVHSLLVEGGAKIIKWFIKEKLWHDAMVITSRKVSLAEGIKSPIIKGKLIKSWQIQKDFVNHIVKI